MLYFIVALIAIALIIGGNIIDNVYGKHASAPLVVIVILGVFLTLFILALIDP